MRYTKEFKLECVRKYKAGERIDDPGGCKHHSFHECVRKWSKMYDSLGEVGFEHKKPKRSWEDKFNMIQRVLNGESFSEVAFSNGIQPDFLNAENVFLHLPLLRLISSLIKYYYKKCDRKNKRKTRIA